MYKSTLQEVLLLLLSELGRVNANIFFFIEPIMGWQ